MKSEYPIFFFLIFILLVSNSSAQDNQLIAPENWRPEEITLPLSFAPDIPIKGIECVQFAPGWGKPESEEYFTYAFAWILEDKKDFNEQDLESFLVAYFDGLMGLVGGFEKVGTSVKINKDDTRFQGQLTSKDGFFTKTVLKLNLTIEKKEQGQIWLFRLTPKTMDHPIWKILNDEVRVNNK